MKALWINDNFLAGNLNVIVLVFKWRHSGDENIQELFAVHFCWDIHLAILRESMYNSFKIQRR